MKNIFLVLITSVLAYTSDQVFADIVSDINNPVVGLIGASHIDPESDINNTMGLTSINGASYRGLADYLKAETITNAKGIVYRENAQGGATTNGTYGSKSMIQQAKELVEHTTMWADGTHMKAALLLQFNDCTHTLAGLCPTEKDVINGPVKNTIETIKYLQSYGITVYISRMANYEQLNYPLTESVFSQVMPNFKMANKKQYQMLKNTYEKHINNIEGVKIINIWDSFDHIGDGLHPDHITKLKAAHIINKEIQKELKRNSVL